MASEAPKVENPVLIRKLAQEDVPWVVSCQAELYLSNFPNAKVSRRFLKSQENWIRDHFNLGDKSAFLVALRENEKVGFIWGKVLENLLEGLEGLVLQNFVLAEHRSTGIGKKLLSRLLAYFDAQGVSKVTLNVTLGNKAALELYRSMGFVPVRYEMERRTNNRAGTWMGRDSDR